MNKQQDIQQNKQQPTRSRLNKLGIKQPIQKCWMDKTVQMMLAGLTESEIRLELDAYLSTQKQSGGIGERGTETYGMAIGILASWFSPDDDLLAFRDKALLLARSTTDSNWFPLHWAVISASYPFWFNVAAQAGRLFKLQDRITTTQIYARVKEQYGDRETVARNVRYTVRSLVHWGVIHDTDSKGCYSKAKSFSITDTEAAVLLFESALHTLPEQKASVQTLLNSPAFFPFELPSLSGGAVAQINPRIKFERYSGTDGYIAVDYSNTPQY